MGARLFAEWLNNPLTDLNVIKRRQEAVAELLSESELRHECRKFLQGIYDLERLITRVMTGKTSPRDLVFIGRTLSSLPKVKAKLTGCSSKLVCEIESRIDLCPDVRMKIDDAIKEDAPLNPGDGGFIKDGYDEQLDQYRELAKGGKQWIANYQRKILDETEISSLKVGFNKVFGYYLEVTNTHRDKVPDYFIRKQTLKKRGAVHHSGIKGI